ncbi:MAG: hypothetical protein R3C01_16250 [Planctomycetaceae bacterium]
MDFDDKGIGFPELLSGMGSWGVAVLILLGIVLVFAVPISMSYSGSRGPGRVAETLIRGFIDVLSQSFRRLFAIATLTFRESVRRKTLWVLAVFVVLFMFAHWFLGAGQATESAAKRHVMFVMSAVTWLLIPIAVILACWGLPNDIKERSLHTVVTKPARRAEIVFGRILGYSAVMTLVLLVMGLFGYIWLMRSVPDSAKNQLIARVPVYGELTFLDRQGVDQFKGINVGDIWDFRSFIEGNSNARAIYTFDRLDESALNSDDALPLEYNFEAFRSYKGTIGQNVRFSFHFVNKATGLDVQYPAGSAYIREYSPNPEDTTMAIPRVLTSKNSLISRVGFGEGATENVPEEVDLLKDMMVDGKLRVEVSCDDGAQYLGMARPDLFFRLPNRSFFVAYAKTFVGMWLMLILIVVLSTTASTFVKGPVATFLVATYLIMGRLLRGHLDELLTQFYKDGKPIGGGLLESAVRLTTQDNQLTPLASNGFNESIVVLDRGILRWLNAMSYIIPDFNKFDGAPYLANGFDVPAETRIVPALIITIGFFIPCLFVGTYSLMSRELEAK